MKKQIISLIILALLPMVANAEEVVINGIKYNLVYKAKTAEVIKNSPKYSGAIVIPDTVVYNDVTYDVTSIGQYAFHQCSGLTSVSIPNSVTRIREDAFAHCSGLDSITIPNSVTRIEGLAFEFCTNLTSIIIPNSINNIEGNVFCGCI